MVILLSLIIILLLYAASALIITQICNSYAVRGQIGDMFGAVNALFSGLAFAGIIYTIYTQREDSIKSKSEYEHQRFENTFFHLFNHFRKTVNNLKYSDVTGEKVLSDIVDRANINVPYNDNAISLMTQEYTKHFYSNTYFYPLSSYLNGLKAIYTFIKKNPLIPGPKEKKYYYDILKDYLTNEEKKLLFYHLILGPSDKTLTEINANLNIIDSIPLEYLIQPTHNALRKQVTSYDREQRNTRSET